ncbi:hypothetical protein MKX01_008137 [Papaver californicum]|nr:hypothetical protein MKX01_008137 [Papaver californicum]
MKTTTPRIEVCDDYVHDAKKTPNYNQFIHLMKKYRSLEEHNRNAVSFVSESIKQIFKDHSELLSKFKTFFPDQYEDDGVAVESHCDDDEALLHLDYSFFEKARTLLRSPDEHKQFLKCLFLYTEDIISRKELQDLTGFTCTGNEEDKCRTTKSTENRPHKRGHCEKDEREKRQGFEASTSKRRRLVKEPKSMLKRLIECTDENPSYKLSTRKNNQISLFASGISTEPGDDEVSHWEPKNKPIETSSEYFKHSFYEEQMFKFEDERVKHDILLGTTKSAEELAAKIGENVGSHICIEDQLSVPQLGCIKRLLGKTKTGLGVMDSFRRNAIPVLQLILTRLHLKQQEESTSLLKSIETMKIVSSSNSSFEQLNTASPSTEDNASASCANPLGEATK